MSEEVKTVHGGLDLMELRSLGLQPDKVLDFSANINPLGPSPSVWNAIASADVSAYPDRHCLALRAALAARIGIDTDHILAGNGSTELIHLVARAYLSPGTPCLILAPTFGEYEAAAVAAGGDIRLLRAHEGDGFQWPMEAATHEIRISRPRLIFLCNPNNPTGVYLDRAQVEEVTQAIGDAGLLVLDEAYVPLADGSWNSVPLLRQGNVVLLRSMTKDHALAGVRLGYLVAAPQVVERVRRFQPTWSVSAVAQAAGLAALEDDGHVAKAREVIREAKAYLQQELGKLEVPAIPSAANFLLARVGGAAEVRNALLRRGICVRDCTSFGLPQYIRIGIRRREECQRLILALQEVIKHG